MTDQLQPSIEGPDITNYWQFFNLDRDPFSMGFDEALIYLPPNWEEMLDLVQYLAHYKNQMVAITGAAGSGKTTFEDIFISQLGETARVIKLNGDPNLDVMRLVEFLSDSFTLPWTPSQNVEEVLDQQLQAFQAKDKVCILVVDNAHLLPEETLEALIYLVEQQSENQMRFHAILFGDPTLVQKVKNILQPNEEALVHFLTLDPFSLEETQNYLNYHLSSAGWQEESPMTEETIARIYKLSEGNPARINRIARRFLVDMLNARQHQDTKTPMKNSFARIIGGIIILLIVVAAFSYWYMNRSASVKTDGGDAAPNISLNGESLSQEIQPGKAVDLQPSKAAESSLPQEPPTPSAPIKTEVSSVAPAPSAPPPVENQPEISTVDMAAMPTIPTTPSEASALSTQVKKTPEKTLAPIEAKTTTSIKKTLKPVTSKVVKKAEGSKTTKDTKTGDYAIQLIGLNKTANLPKFIKEHHLQNKVKLMTITQKDKKMTIVLYGKYHTLHEAEQAITTLPPDLAKLGPWPRKVYNAGS